MDIMSILKDLHEVSGARMSIHSIDGEELFAYPMELSPFCEHIQQDYFMRRGCVQCDHQAYEQLKKSKEPHIYQCGCGLFEGVAPIYHYGVLSGYLMMGQVKDESLKNDEYIHNYSRSLFETEEEQNNYFKKIKMLPSAKLRSLARLMGIVAEYLTNYNRITTKADSLPEQIKKFINRNYSKTITLDEIAKRFDCSKSTIMNVFRKKYGVTVIAYLNQVRLEQASRLICDTDLSFKEIAGECGFYDQNYFSKQFTAKFGCSPTVFRASCRSQSTES